MFFITYDTWKAVCDMYFKQKIGRLKSYIQWFPFSKLNIHDKEKIKSKEFFQQYIQSGAAVLFPKFLFRTNNYMQKSDGSFRNSSLLSPLSYLLFESIGKTISRVYHPKRPSDISVFYAGNFDEMRCFYKYDYDAFCKEINAELENYDYFIKTDIRDFFKNINLNKLFSRIDQVSNENCVSITQYQLHLYKEFIYYCGNGNFPLIENSVATSYLATIIYLDDIDVRLNEFIINKIPEIKSFKMVRYVDDLYILIQTDQNCGNLNNVFNDIINEYSSILYEYDLAVNSSKVTLKKVSELNGELKKSLYDEYFNGIKFEIEELANDNVITFLNNIESALLYGDITVDDYNEIIKKSFLIEDVEFTPQEIFNYFIFEKSNVFQNKEVIETINRIICKNISFISLDPKRLTIMILNTKSDMAIKAFLNQLFNRHRAKKWNSYDTTIAINYLIQRGFKHRDLLDVIKLYCTDLYNYYVYFCKNSFISSLNDVDTNKFCNAIKPDHKTYYLYIMYLFEEQKGNMISAFAFFKNYFDRVTAHIAFASHYDDSRKPNYKLFYKESEHKKFYNSINGGAEIIHNAHVLRNSNPLSHSSAELVENNNSTGELKQFIKDMKGLIISICKEKGLI
ncbi:AbiA family abortive infection protein [Thermoanaerobacterium thermosulfurigenes]|uniref:AbiA family abortive infection protein n=1 Tax=Thermoanaerobacterium thermosulfurigenes TaxID=33950 RepID=UPI003EF9D99F